MNQTKLIIRTDRSRCFARIPNAVIDDVKSFESQPAAMHMLLRLYRTNERSFGSKGNIANLLGMTPNRFYQRLKTLVELGYAKKEGKDIVLDLVGEPDIVETEYDIESEPEQEVLAELKAEPKRESTGLTEKDRTKLIVEAWNACESDKYQTLVKLTPWNRMAIEAHGKRLKVERDDYSWITQVLNGGLKIDRFLPPSDAAGPSWVFGKNEDSIGDWKFQQIQNAYDQGKAAAKQEKIQTGGYSDEEVLQWFNERVTDHPASAVHWFELPPYQGYHGQTYEIGAAWEHEENQRGDGCLWIYVPHGKRTPVHWSYKGFRHYPNKLQEFMK